jgi:hypothetical protein
MSRATLPEMTEETQAAGFQYSYEVDEPAKPGEGKVFRTALDSVPGYRVWAAPGFLIPHENGFY